MPPRLAPTREGSTDLLVPEESLRAKAPKTFPAFFNPAARVNRDVSVAIAAVTNPGSFLDALAGVGARGVRVANEASKTVEVTMVEFNRESAAVAERNVARNKVGSRCEVVHEESNAYLHSRFGRLERFDAVDVDPFGTPAPYVQGALTAAADGGVVSLTATDTATLCGVYPKVAARRYGAAVFKSEFPHEAGIRVLLGFCARVGGVIDAAIEPVAAHSTLHYLRVYFRVQRGAARSDRCLGSLGYVVPCSACHQNSTEETPSGRCPKCGARTRPLGPLWVGGLVDEEVVGKAARVSAERGWREAARVLEGLAGSDRFPPYGYSVEGITSREGISSVRLAKVAERLAQVGRESMRQPFESSGLKTTADYVEVLAAVKESAR